MQSNNNKTTCATDYLFRSVVLLAALLGSPMILTEQALTWAAEDHNDDPLVLVSSVTSALTYLPLRQARRLFLGASVTVDGEHLQPLLNASDERLQEQFAARIVHMSVDTYEKRFIKHLFARGSKRPRHYQDESYLAGDASLFYSKNVWGLLQVFLLKDEHGCISFADPQDDELTAAALVTAA